MIALIEFMRGNILPAKYATYETQTPDLIESAKIITEMCNMYLWITGYNATASLHRTMPKDCHELPELSRGFF